MTWSRRVSRGGDGARSLGWDVVAAGSAGFVDEVLFAPQLGQAVAGLADGLAAVIDTREGVHLGNELGDGEPVRRWRRWRQRQGGAQRVSHAAFVEVDTADPVLTRMATGHTRYPVVGADDDPGGVIHLRDLLDPDARFGTAETRCRPAVFVPTTLPLPNVVRLRTLGTAGSPSRARRLLGRHVPVLGGTASAAGSARAGARESRRLGALLSGMGTADLATALTSIGLEDLVGQDRFSVLDALITFIAGDGDDLDAQAARDAACDVLEDLFGNADQWADLASINVTADDLNRMLEMFLSLYVYNRVPVIAERLSRLDNPAQSRHADQEMRLIIADMVAIHLPEDPFTIDWRGGAGPGLGRRRDRQCLRSVERADRSWLPRDNDLHGAHPSPRSRTIRCRCPPAGLAPRRFGEPPFRSVPAVHGSSTVGVRRPTRSTCFYSGQRPTAPTRPRCGVPAGIAGPETSRWNYPSGIPMRGTPLTGPPF